MTSRVREIDDRDFVAEVLEAPGLVVVDFWAPWCGPCRAMAPVLEGLAGRFPDRVRVVKINVDVNPVWASELSVGGIPALFFFQGGQPVDGVVGFQSESALVRRVEGLLRPAA